MLNSADWEKLKQNFRSNDYYPADVVFNGETARNVGIRSRGLGSRSDRKPGLRVDMNRYADGQTFLGEHVIHARQPDPGCLDGPRDGDDEALRPSGDSGAARVACAALRQQLVRRRLRRRRGDRQALPRPHLRHRRRGHAERRLSVRVQVRRAVVLHLSRLGSRAVQAAVRGEDEGEQERPGEVRTDRGAGAARQRPAGRSVPVGAGRAARSAGDDALRRGAGVSSPRTTASSATPA